VPACPSVQVLGNCYHFVLFAEAKAPPEAPMLMNWIEKQGSTVGLSIAHECRNALKGGLVYTGVSSGAVPAHFNMYL
jgi:hypothetical protein